MFPSIQGADMTDVLVLYRVQATVFASYKMYEGHQGWRALDISQSLNLGNCCPTLIELFHFLMSQIEINVFTNCQNPH